MTATNNVYTDHIYHRRPLEGFIHCLQQAVNKAITEALSIELMEGPTSRFFSRRTILGQVIVSRGSPIAFGSKTNVRRYIFRQNSNFNRGTA